jgi:hypothetical protein
MEDGNEAYKNNNTMRAARIRRVVFDHAVRAAVLVYSHASSIVSSPAAEEAIFATASLKIRLLHFSL